MWKKSHATVGREAHVLRVTCRTDKGGSFGRLADCSGCTSIRLCMSDAQRNLKPEAFIADNLVVPCSSHRQHSQCETDTNACNDFQLASGQSAKRAHSSTSSSPCTTNELNGRCPPFVVHARHEVRRLSLVREGVLKNSVARTPPADKNDGRTRSPRAAIRTNALEHVHG